MSYVLRGRLAGFFRANGNVWSTRKEVDKSLGVGAAHHLLAYARGDGWLEKECGREGRMRYRIDPGKLYAETTGGAIGEAGLLRQMERDRKQTERVTKITEAFCERHRVRVPYEATRRSPEALLEWCELVRSA